MSADYLPVHDPAVHGPAYAVRVPGRHTQPFAAVRPYAPQAGPCPPEACRCDEHKYGQVPGRGTILHAGSETVGMLVDRAVRDGRYEDIEAYAEDTAPLNIHRPAVETARRIHRNVASGLQRIEAALAADDDARYDADLRGTFLDAYTAFSVQLTEMRRWLPEYEAWLLTEGRDAR